jgi:crotonobetainyl-CoA:carnitine CoA-transferase CaiB-like acyl-CoA transferase
MHETVNRNKRSLALDLHGEAGRALFLRLAIQSDVVIENFRPAPPTTGASAMRPCASCGPT